MNPRLRELEARYRACASEVTTPLLWVPAHLQDDDLLYFRGDNAYVYAVAHQDNEGDTDLGIIGDCCIEDQQGPELYLNAESLLSQNLVLWYVPQQQTVVSGTNSYCWTLQGGDNPETYPCLAGPMFVPAFAAGLWDDGPTVLGQATHFTSTTLAGASYLWDFGDGGGAALTATAAYTYAAPGDYTVTLTISDTLVSGVYTSTVFVGLPPAAAFDTTPGVAPSSTFTFTDASTGTGPLGYLWAFGDGLTSTLPSPPHTYWVSGPLTVSLTVSNPLGSATAQTPITVAVHFAWLPIISVR